MTTPPQDPPRRGLRRVLRWWGSLSEPRQVLAVWTLVLVAVALAGLWASSGGGVEAPEVPFRDVAVGWDHACGLRADGSIACWGLNESGQAQAPEGTFRAIAVKGHISCGLRVDGSVECWIPSSQVLEGPFTAVAVGPWGNFCALRPDGTLECRGSLIPGEDREFEYPSGRFLDISVGESQACGIRADGKLECWGETSDLPEGHFSAISAGLDYACGLRVDRTVVCWRGQGEWQILQERAGPFSAVSAGEYHACGLRTDQTLECWRNGRRVGSYDPMNRWFFELKGLADPPGGEFIAVNVESDQSCGVRINGAVVCWGQNSLLDDNGKPLYAQNPIDTPPGQFIAVSASTGHVCGLRTDSTIDCWGDNSHGQADPPGGEFSAVAAGEYHTCGLRTTGSIRCWGSNRDGETEAPDWKFNAVTAGAYKSCGLRDDGSIECWGDVDFRTITVKKSFDRYTVYGEDEDGRLKDRWEVNEPGQAVVPDIKFSAVGVPGSYTCGLRTDGRIECWGRHGGERDLPTGSFVAISDRGSCGLRDTGRIECWVGDFSGPRTPPEGAFSALSSNAGLGGCGIHAEDGRIECWGQASFDLSVPQGTFQAVSVNRQYGCGIRADRTLACWDGDPTVKPAPDGVRWQCTLKWWSRWLSPFNTC